MNKSRLIGAHVSSSGGVDQAVLRAAAITANCMQVFSGSPRSWRRAGVETVPVDKLWAKQKELGVLAVFTHALYLINLTADKPELQQKSIAAVQYDLAFDSKIKGQGVVVHLGSHLGRGWEAVRADLVKILQKILQTAPADAHLLIENSAGQKGKLTSDLTEIRWLLDQVADPRLGWCFDTCHAHAAGYFLGNNKSKNGKNAAEIITELNLWSNLKCIHVNDSRDDFASGRDRHANIGQGQIKTEDLQFFLNQPEAIAIPIITEVPGFANQGPDEQNLRLIRALVE